MCKLLWIGSTTAPSLSCLPLSYPYSPFTPPRLSGSSTLSHSSLFPAPHNLSQTQLHRSSVVRMITNIRPSVHVYSSSHLGPKLAENKSSVLWYHRGKVLRVQNIGKKGMESRGPHSGNHSYTQSKSAESMALQPHDARQNPYKDPGAVFHAPKVGFPVFQVQWVKGRLSVQSSSCRTVLLYPTDDFAGLAQAFDHLLALLSSSDSVVALLQKLVEFLCSVHLLK